MALCVKGLSPAELHYLLLVGVPDAYIGQLNKAWSCQGVMWKHSTSVISICVKGLSPAELHYLLLVGVPDAYMGQLNEKETVLLPHDRQV